MYPICTFIASIALDVTNVQSAIVFHVLVLAISIAIAEFFYQHLVHVIEFIAAHQSGA